MVVECSHELPRCLQDRAVLGLTLSTCASCAILPFWFGFDSENPFVCYTPWRRSRFTEHMLGRTRRVAAWHELCAQVALTSVRILPAQGRHERRRRAGCKQGVWHHVGHAACRRYAIPMLGVKRARDAPCLDLRPHASLLPAAVRGMGTAH